MLAEILSWLKDGSGATNDASPKADFQAIQAVDKHEGGKKMSEISTAYLNNRVGPVMRQGELARAVVEAAEIDNPGRKITVDDKVAYLRISTDDELILRRETIEEMLGRPFSMNELEIELSSFAGRIETKDDKVRFYYSKHL